MQLSTTHRLCLAACAALVLLPACKQPTAPRKDAIRTPATTPTATAVPATPAAATTQPVLTPDAALTRTLVGLYGAKASASSSWTTVPVDAGLRLDEEEPGAVTRRVCARGPGAGPDEQLVAVCGQVEAFGHVTPGVLDLYRLQAGAVPGVIRLAARESGSMGNPGEVAVRRFGAQLAGFEVTSSFYNMGQGVGTRQLFLARPTRIDDAGWMRDGLYYKEDCKGTDCADAFNLTFDLAIDNSNPQASMYPLVVTEHGTECGRKVSTVRRIPFDAKSAKYVIPDALQRENCTGKKEE